jgi:hypothetical protein
MTWLGQLPTGEYWCLYDLDAPERGLELRQVDVGTGSSILELAERLALAAPECAGRQKFPEMMDSGVYLISLEGTVAHRYAIDLACFCFPTEGNPPVVSQGEGAGLFLGTVRALVDRMLELHR